LEESAHRHVRCDEADTGGDERHQQSLDEQLGDDTATAGAECRPHRQFRGAGRRPREDQQPHVGAGHCEDEEPEELGENYRASRHPSCRLAE
jgi:hypothetical protein